MAELTIQNISPNDGQVAVPIGSTIEITLSEALDPKTVKDNVIVYGRDLDFISGPETAVYLRGDGTNPDFLKSPGYKGVVKTTVDIEVVNSLGETVEDYIYTSRDQFISDGYLQKIVLTPENNLAEENSFTVFIVGVNSSSKKGLAKRTVFDINTDLVTSATGEMLNYGGYSGTAEDTVSVEITESGSIGAAKYKWWYSGTENVSEARKGKVTSRRFRKLEDGIQIRFSGSGFIAGDIYTFKVSPAEYLQESYSFSFDTSSDQIVDVPETASTSVIGDPNFSIASQGYLEVESITPADGATHQKFSSKRIVIEFDREIDPETVTDDTVSLFKYPVSGIINSNDEEVELFKKITVDGKKIIIEV